MKEIKPISEAAIEEAYGSPYAEGDIENVAFIQANTDRAIMNENIQEALSANNAKWRENIEAELSTYRNMIKQYPDAPIGSMAEEVIKTLESILSQMEGE